ncbi:monooxygenase, FAD-binding protein [Metarhizium rileyi]|uniref:Monooxygenase, FAD-binding protein n=1 Tax=Metarhizium rileyi (strain RCEF 4871) TaxID=1649241 RepID=A0A166RXB7_METRR|nr:monooxygenase, FAD-binding protein [Metarhizium rileyi RCEF 4871]
MPISTTDVLIVGAGPTGLVLALWLSKLGVKVRIIDKAAHAATSTRALAVQARTLELYAQYDAQLADDVIGDGRKVVGFNAWAEGKRMFHVPLARVGEKTTPYPFIHVCSQHDHERTLTVRLYEDFGISVETQTELLGFKPSTTTSDNGRLVARLARISGQDEVEAKYVAGCDGSHSAVRKTLGISCPGGIYDQTFYVADIQGAGPTMDGHIHVCLDQADFLSILPFAEEGHARLVGTVRQSEHPAGSSHALSFDHVSRRAMDRMEIQVHDVNWFSAYRLHHRVADHFRQGRAFLLGDAAHVHSPVGGQGMNAGIGDAVNLAWKMAAVLAGDADDSLLDTYEEERAHFARRLVATTDRVFSLATREGWFARFVRASIVPVIAPILFSLPVVRRFMFRTVSQISLNYSGMSLSLGRVGSVTAGQRLPWVVVDGTSNHESLSSMRWQIHVYGYGTAATNPLLAWSKSRGVKLTVFEWTTECASVGLTRNAVYVVRPDGYVAMAQDPVDIDAIELYFDDRQIMICS